ncbi:hypothetical protein P170DRAFT_479449 [Aspergillus steynii IBT 23096]|uniref:PD-(D/E)XK nuclease-like domain-containing protein n=1 Tax=Aspergillus steynii IBT 23096 TaxID=1392250 RepID=A0A2I2FWA3_9EURO|nr:uncharacterized protein P170DRAFT_479449 [Aspergillus steynii IBT 23096]PLB44908.1 hypothetical protein P170DRAFT_479449 [Aspergillus steynii IBT 23096]
MDDTERDAITEWIEGVATDDLSPSGSTRSDITANDRSRQPSSSPTRTKSNLASATPKIRYLHESADPGSELARELLALLTAEDNDGWEPETHEIDKVSAASHKCDAQLRSESSWVIEVVRPLLQCAIGTLPLECWSVQTETVDPKYQPRYTARDTYSRKIDLVVGFPTDEWPDEYERMAALSSDRCFSHITHPHTGARFLGPGFEIKASDGNLVEAQVQLGVWMAGLITWMWERRCKGALPPPVVGCISIGERWDFYIIYGVEIVGSARPEVRVWGPLSDLDARTGSRKATTLLAKRLRQVMKYTESQYFQQLLKAFTPS